MVNCLRLYLASAECYFQLLTTGSAYFRFHGYWVVFFIIAQILIEYL